MAFDRYLYVTDYERDQIIILTPVGELVGYVGAKGKGPGEFLGASDITVRGDSMWVYNDGNGGFEVFRSDGHLQTIRLPDNIDYSGGFNFFLFRNRLFMSSVSETNSICSFDVRTSTIERFGQPEAFDTDKHTRIRNYRHLAGNDSCIFAVSDNMPVIEKYDHSGQMLETLNYSRIPIVRKRLGVIREDINPNGYTLLVQDVCYDNGKLYLLLYANNGNRISCNDILVIDVSERNMSCHRLLNLGDSWYRTICASGSRLYAFGNNGLEGFILE
ncbi:MAG: 6-bladed beta-propeller [Bacteroidales bacterium]